MTDMPASGGGRLMIRKPISLILADARRSELKRTLGAVNLVSLGVGAIIGAGIFVMTGNAAANYAGPGVMLSFVLAGLVCAVAGLCYAELASTMPVSGSAYTYAYGTLGEAFAWAMGWLLLLEYGIAASTVAAGWTGYVYEILKDFGILIPDAIRTATISVSEVAIPGSEQVGLRAEFLPSINLVGALGILAVTALLVVGVSESASFTNLAVILKVAVLLIFIAIGLTYVQADNWTPLIPANDGKAWNSYGFMGVAYAATIIFFAYVGFEAVSTAAGEAKNPQKDLPIGILGSLFICTVIYMLVAAVLTGVVPYKELGVSAPIAVAIDRMNPPWALVPFATAEGGQLNLLTFMIKIGAIMGLSSVMLALCYAQTRVFYQMSRDGLVPKVFGDVHPKFKTPASGTTLLGIIIALAAATMPLNLLGSLVSLGTAAAFGIVCISVLYLRKTAPDLERPFRVPFYPFLPLLGIVLCACIIGLIFFEKWTSLMKGNWVPITILFGYFAIGFLVYALYGMKNSKLAKGEAVFGDVSEPLDSDLQSENRGH
jgi:basic amino acid/polyamine antiporter, APA family